ncbi:DUF5683 domain-containing protein [Nafulsella turpanensis]|uniref:DUF5683 domain-containing protein n=1 Tax=Nafulsella turpanensis TaxID=1265690 RepID=UPI00034D5A10|nr:DUF5683 domain-containing protein [Nafulsella turpanensis]
MRKAALRLWLSGFIVLLPLLLQAQVPDPLDSTLYDNEPPLLDTPKELVEDPVAIVDSVSLIKPGKAAFYSAVLPGLGQAYNNAHWKIPIIYAGGAFVVYTVNFYNRQYSVALRNLQYIQFQPGVTEVNGRDADFYNRVASAARRQRDYIIILGTLLYTLNIVEAYVDAHLQDFNLSEDLALRLKPSIFAVPAGQTGAGIALTLRVK